MGRERANATRARAGWVSQLATKASPHQQQSRTFAARVQLFEPDSLLNRVEIATRCWIKDFVIKEQLCPFARKLDSAVHIHVERFGKSNEEVVIAYRTGWSLDPDTRADEKCAQTSFRMVNKKVNSWKKVAVEHPTTSFFIVFPCGLDDPDVFQDYVAAITQANNLMNGANMFTGALSTECPLSVFPFHPKGHPDLWDTKSVWGVAEHEDDKTTDANTADTDQEVKDARYASPFPMIHFIPTKELIKSRKLLDKKEPHLLDVNNEKMDSATQQDKIRWHKLVVLLQNSVRLCMPNLRAEDLVTKHWTDD